MNRTARWFRRNLLPTAIAAIVFLAAWDLLIRIFDIKKFIAPSPLQMITAMWADSKTLVEATGLTALAAVSGLSLSVVIGTSVGVVFSHVGWLRRGLYPYAIFLQTVPIVAIAPLLVLWIGNGIASVIAVAFLLSLFPIITNVTSGMLATPIQFKELFALNSATWWQTFSKLEFPHMIPSLITGIKVSGGLAVIGAIVGEFFVGYGQGGHGLGFMIRQSVDMNRNDRLFAVVFLSTMLGVAIFAITGFVANTGLRRWCAEDRFQR